VGWKTMIEIKTLPESIGVQIRRALRSEEINSGV
jgi:hypothetical protein